MSNNSEKMLIIFKNPRYYNIPIVNKFAHNYNVDYIFISNLLEKNNKEISNLINENIKNKNISIVLLEGDHLSLINTNFINEIKDVKKGLFFLDDYMYHEVNSITASVCDFVIGACPLAILKFKEKGYNAFYMPIEADGNIFKNYKLEKNIDVLFFGKSNKDRDKYLHFIKKNNIKLKQVSPDSPESFEYEDLAKLISKSKIVVNFSRAAPLKKKFSSTSIYKDYYEIKGRLIISGLCGAACVTEYAPAHSILFKDEELISFKNKEECVNVIKKLLADPKKLENYTSIFSQKCLDFEDKIFSKKIKNFTNTLVKGRPITPVISKIPFWYRWLFAKQKIWIYFRNNKLVPFFKNAMESAFLTKRQSIMEYLIVVIYTIIISLIFIIKFPIHKVRKKI